ncbi:unnamed protein product [Ceutorhynchus assimilis]|uniref:Uncharacterized protein n=1 Tax=Ceutorhynchus assimilis TaxID=467358 RepID=A0A9N9MFF1_9CUCU|nr:unnamed protein product [Ceutorhynchus assimilis]
MMMVLPPFPKILINNSGPCRTESNLPRSINQTCKPEPKKTSSRRQYSSETYTSLHPNIKQIRKPFILIYRSLDEKGHTGPTIWGIGALGHWSIGADAPMPASHGCSRGECGSTNVFNGLSVPCGDGNAVPTANDNTIQIQAGLDNNWSTGGVTHTVADTVVNDEDNEISSSYFSSTKLPNYTSKKTTPYGNHEETTMRYAESYPPPILQISVSNAPVGYTPLPTIQRPMFRPKPPKPTDENYILIPTLTHESNKPNKTEDDEAVAIESVNLINHSTSSRPLTTFSYVSSSTPSDRKSTSKKPPSTSYVYSTTIPPRRTESTTNRKPIKSTISSSITSSKPPSTSYVYSSTFRPTSSKPNNVYSSTSRPNTVAHSTFASTPEGFPGSSTPSFVSSSSYGPSTTSSHIAGPGFTVTSQPIGHYSSYPTPAPTVIVLGPISEDSDKDDGYILASSSSRPTLPTRIGDMAAKAISFSSITEKRPSSSRGLVVKFLIVWNHPKTAMLGAYFCI